MITVSINFYSLFASLLLLVLSACNSSFKKGERGIEYKLIGDKSSGKLLYGNYFEFQFAQQYKDDQKDTLLGDTRESVPRIEKFDSLHFPSSYINILSQARLGDSIVIRIKTDSAFNDARTMPSYMKKGGLIYTTIKVNNIYTKAEQADSASEAQFKLNEERIYQKRLVAFTNELKKLTPQIQNDSKFITDHLNKTNTPYIKGKWGTFIIIKNQGNGKKIAYNDVVAVNYTAKTLGSNKVYDSNTDPSFSHFGSYEVIMSHLGSVLLGWTDALFELSNGSKAIVIIPSSLAYGKKGKLPAIKPDENVVYEMEIMNVIPEDSAMKMMNSKRRADLRLN